MPGISWLAEELLASNEGLCSIIIIIIIIIIIVIDTTLHIRIGIIGWQL